MNRKSFCAWLALVVAVAQAPAVWGGKCPHVAVLLDVSSSMTQDENGMTPAAMGNSKLEVAAKTLETAMLNPYDGKIPIGFAAFPIDATCGVGGLSVPIKYGTKSQIKMAIPVTTQTGTPMCTAIDAVAKDLAFADPERPHAIILITDGLPTCSCDIASTEAAIARAHSQSPPINIFVVGFGKVTEELTNLNRLALAGGVSAKIYGNHQPQDFYYAPTAAGLKEAIGQIMNIITGGDAGNGSFCDDSCYQNTCAADKDICVAGECTANPCAKLTCSPGEYCFTDGKTSYCTSPCMMSCTSGQSCNPVSGKCEVDPCDGACGNNEKCTAMGCVNDTRCTTLTCKSGQRCVDGMCREDPCRYIQCPADHACVPLSGACTPFDKALGLLPVPPTADELKGGLQCDATGARSAGASWPLLGAALLLFQLHARAEVRRLRRRPGQLPLRQRL